MNWYELTWTRGQPNKDTCLFVWCHTERVCDINHHSRCQTPVVLSIANMFFLKSNKAEQKDIVRSIFKVHAGSLELLLLVCLSNSLQDNSTAHQLSLSLRCGRYRTWSVCAAAEEERSHLTGPLHLLLRFSTKVRGHISQMNHFPWAFNAPLVTRFCGKNLFSCQRDKKLSSSYHW